MSLAEGRSGTSATGFRDARKVYDCAEGITVLV